MAIIKFGQLIVEARGKLGGTVFSRNASGSYMRSKITPTNPGTNSQSLQRSKFSSVSQKWRSLDDPQRLSWENLAKELSRTNIFGDNVPLSGFNCFSRLNNNLLLCGVGMISVAPYAYSPTPVSSLGFGNLTPSLFKLEFFPAALLATDQLFIFSTPGFSPGISFIGNKYRLVEVTYVEATSPYDISATYIDKFGAPIVGKKVSVKVFTVDNRSGLPSSVRVHTQVVVVDVP